ncbi:P-loop containing nucleoside triphosphate hydrolase protein [Sphaerosporella brunnea]|uniref:P-loop containing nucleoside triphosphate hydrolase protein n=1 Tax=Sphaerosporella brunnea TaxID=1250544 RepID=A0A5J5FBR1_9PEZI|nr:P-loop containing nucleoside triphosphate hydrolase protein [Sphaerosporella brunnea]
MPAFGASAADRAAKIPGMMEPAWPIKGASHVRGEETPDGFRSMDIIVGFGGQKLKDARILITPEEDILVSIARKLHIDNIIADIRSDDYHERKHFDVPAEIRLPQRLIATGSQLQEMIRPRIAARLPHPQALSQQMEEVDSDSESAAHMTITATGVHRALLRLYERLGTELTAFDMHKCDASPWEVKYAPETIGEILQLGREAGVIKEWLTGLRTDKVHTGCTKGKRKAKPKASASKKRRKKGGDMDGFLVDSEEERGIMNEIAEASPEEIDWLNPVAKTKKSTIRTGGKMAELLGKKKDKTNTIVISGPTGCGKTAAVYAAAKELGYTVFEVNSGMRRSGKDVIDMVGDMSRNHQVGNQSVMESDNPFSKAKAAKSAAVAIEDDLQMRQRQSLILFEEVDILFEEDKSFWITVIGLMAQSKRPIVLTCNNETLLPWDDLTLHAVLRFSLPPRDLLVDHLLLMAANEGHLLQRPAVDALVQAKSNDLRACIMELQFHCRMAVGDRKGGLDWWIHRFPAGCDIAENGEKNRVISVDTYTLGMGMIPNVPDLNEDDKWRGLWDEYGLDIGASVNGLEDYARAMEEAGVDKQVSLRITDAFFEARSAADAFAPLEASSLDQPRLDFTLPKRKKNPKLVLDDLYGIKILQTDPSTIPTAETELAICMRSLAREYVSSVAKKFSVDLKPMDNAFLLDAIVTRNVPEGITRMTMQNLFAPLSKAETMFASTPATLHSSIYPSLTMLTVGIAPWVRNILRRDIAMEKERRKASNLLSMGGKRRTRAARLAVEGGDRMRKERHFRALGADVVACSAGEDWEHAVEYEQERRRREMVNNV